ncbi:dynamin family protein [Streptomyces griseomycini]|uniref:tRNA U34 5-carboxymethylaminomethyl modifying GTPase MnmE/TrmE n=1 Tax=Streptomyces griseomycini TaxID=66895 RepID=A0A7W7M105_9ACTN|nr:dynamin family protein [Streptomyces griseomycini]MBB4899216.1 tRNA U34 5-carboxymethylaminomethyl modifying GTPase MnmE/TrmE [Streptomyces griseomycini]
MNDKKEITNMGNNDLARFKARKQELIEVIQRLRKVAADLGDTAAVTAMDALAAKVDRDVFKVVFLGQFRRGKSTVINSELGREVLPAFAVPTTEIPIEVRYGEEPYAVLHPRDGGAQVRIPVEQLAAHVVIDNEQPERKSRFERCEVYYPLPLCENGVELVDTAGTDDDEERERVTFEYLTQADACVYVLDCTQPMGINERDFLVDRLLPLGQEDMFFVYNRINLVPEEERDRVIEVATARVTRISADGRPLRVKPERIFFLDAKGALDGCTAADPQAVAVSGLPEFDRALRTFLAQERGRAKLLGPARELRYKVQDARRMVADRQAMYHQSLEELEANYEAAQPQLELLEQQRRTIAGSLAMQITAIEQDVEAAARSLFATLAEECPQFTLQAELEHKLGANPLTHKQQVEAVVEELAEVVDQWIKDRAFTWTQDTLAPLLEESTAKLHEGVSTDLEHFLDTAHKVMDTVSGNRKLSMDDGAGPPLERVLAGLGGTVLLDPGLGAIGARFGAGEMVRAVFPQLAVLVIGLMVGLGPLGIMAALTATALLLFPGRLERMTNKVREKVGEEIADGIRSQAPDTAREIACGVGERLRALADAVDTGLEARAASVRQQIEAALHDKRVGQKTIDEQQKLMLRLAQTLNEIEAARSGLEDAVRG